LYPFKGLGLGSLLAKKGPWNIFVEKQPDDKDFTDDAKLLSMVDAKLRSKVNPPNHQPAPGWLQQFHPFGIRPASHAPLTIRAFSSRFWA